MDLLQETEDYIKATIDHSLGLAVSNHTLELKLRASEESEKRLHDQCLDLQIRLKEKDELVDRARAEASLNAQAVRKFVEEATISFISLLLLLQSLPTHPNPLLKSPYLSPDRVLYPDYQKMLSTFKIYTYPPPNTFTFPTTPESLFHLSLLNSPFRTPDPTRAHLFFVPFPPTISSRALTRYIKELRVKFPYWNRTLGADHFYISRAGINYSADRNALELKKNAVQVSVFPTLSGNFIPHKDISLPPSPPPHAPPHAPLNQTATFLTFINRDDKNQPLPDDLLDDPDFVVAPGPSDLRRGKYCVFFYGGDVSWLGQALGAGCVPVVITDRPIQDLPLMDVLRWQDVAVFVGSTGGIGELKRAVSGIGEDRYELMRRLGVTAAQHLLWNETPQPLDAFHMVMYQLWLRRHTIRYARWESA